MEVQGFLTQAKVLVCQSREGLNSGIALFTQLLGNVLSCRVAGAVLPRNVVSLSKKSNFLRVSRLE